MNKNIFLYDNYLKLIEDFVLHQKAKGLKYSYQKLSDELGIQKSYLSKVLAGHANLNSDQFYLFTKLLNIEEQELQFTELLLAKERCGILERREKISQKISLLRKENTKTESTLKIKNVNNENLSQYYLNPWAQLIHVALTIEKYRENLVELRNHLRIGDVPFNDALNVLETLELVKWDNGKIQIQKNSIHLSKESSFFWPWRNNVIQLGQIKSQSHAQEDCYNFSVFFTSEPKVKEQIHSAFLQYLKKVENLVKNSDSKELYQMNFDLIPWF